MTLHISLQPAKLALLVIGLLFAFLPLSNILISKQAAALTGSSFNPGHIIDDVIFTDANAMSEQDIQTFLNAKVGSCDNNGSQIFSGSETRAQYDASIGENTKFTCINQYYENPTSHANNLDGNPVPSGGISAAQIIFNAAQQYQINPEIILSTIQKEQGLVADTWPWDSEYTDAMGYDCPETGCQSQYAGFYNQITNAAWQFHQYMINPNNFNHVVGNSYVYYSSASGCNGSTVYIQNEATAALYNYTPYQPNAAALANVSDSTSGGSGDSCSSYGNRNFWWYFNEWFGPSLTNPYVASATESGQSFGLKASQSFTAQVRVENLGLDTWYDDATASANGQYPVHLAATGPINRSSTFATRSWYNPGRPDQNFSAVYDADGVTLAPNQDEATPGEIVQYNIPMQIPVGTAPGTYQEWFQPILEGAPQWWMSGGVEVIVAVQPTNYSASLYSNYNNLGLKTSQSFTDDIFYQNTGNIEWFDSTGATAAGGAVLPVHLAATNPINRGSIFSSSWYNPGRLAINFAAVYDSDGKTLSSNQHMVSPGQIVEFTANFTIPIGTNTGTYQEWFQPILEGAPQWWIGGETYTNVTVQPTSFSATLVGQSPTLTISKGSSTSAYMLYQNTGNIEWYDDTGATSIGGTVKPVHLAATNPINRSSVFADPSWYNLGRPALNFSTVYQSDGTTLSSNQHMVSPGQIAKFTFALDTPSNITSGTYNEAFQPILEGASQWSMGGQGTIQIIVP